MNVCRLVIGSYISLLAYGLLLVAVTTLTMGHVLPAFLQLAMCGALFVVGYGGHQHKALGLKGGYRSPAPVPPATLPRWLYWLLGLSVVGASVSAMHVYVGLWPAGVLEHLISGGSLYASYQMHNAALHAAGGVRGFSITVAELVYIKAVLLWSAFDIFPHVDRFRLPESFLLVSVAVAQAYMGVSRGTGLEFFELGTVFVFALMMRWRASGRLGRKAFGLVGVLVGLVLLYPAILDARGATSSTLESGGEVQLENLGNIGSGWNALIGVLLRFYDYFGFGFHYIGTFWSKVWLKDASMFFAGSIPGGYVFAGVDVRSEMKSLLEMGVRWHPDSILLVTLVGVPGLLVTCLLLGRLAAHLEARHTLGANVLLYYLFVQMLSFPAGNFVWVDTINLVIVYWLVLLSILRRLGLVAPSFREFFRGVYRRRVGERAILSPPIYSTFES